MAGVEGTVVKLNDQIVEFRNGILYQVLNNCEEGVDLIEDLEAEFEVIGTNPKRPISSLPTIEKLCSLDEIKLQHDIVDDIESLVGKGSMADKLRRLLRNTWEPENEWILERLKSISKLSKTGILKFAPLSELPGIKKEDYEFVVLDGSVYYSIPQAAS